ncbi:hypothetical protein SAMN05720473_11080 [Fibrobacter sp. UWB15]|uniref:hypothetical protein n=1 Tax=unclassified Fibrobacter TaxID=2634177 RepID=UPI00091CA47B|nr:MULTISPECIES: hypothetical protein [unclassified Fibrobacter]PWJ62867.1 hypothetical protein BGW99_11080 [Fibrobacter sp. UWB6]SHG46097.1 hypothetical protein SAMN05720760_11180 [Fibrobacter sp. UWB8]SMG39799.1 hypothetical protein SAMN05720473_11080 [Fibrobacter sp. UWB15]
MLNIKQNFYMAGAIALIALAACSSDSPTTAGSTTIPNATAENSSSSNKVTTSSSDNAITSSADEEINSSSSNNEAIAKQDIVFTTSVTARKKIAQGEVVVYGDENGAHASCSAGKYASTKEYDAKISIADGKTTERTLWLRNFGDACKDILKSFKESCSIGKTVVSQDAACNDNGNLKVFCFATNTDSIGDFNVIIEDFTKQSNEICGSIADGVDSTEYDLPVSEPDSNIKANSDRKFIIAPNTENLEVSDEERTILDSLAKAFPQKSTTDPIDGMTRFINYDAQYNFTTPKERYTIPEEDDPNFCTIEEYKEETGLIRSVITSSFRTLQTTMLLTSDNSIAYLAYGEIGSSVETVKNLFQAECEANNGSFYDYYPYAEKVAVACAVKNFTGIPFETIVSEQQSLCDNDYKNF